MIKKISVICALLSVLCSGAFAAENEEPKPTPIRGNIFSTSSDWERVTGLRLKLYPITFRPYKRFVGRGLEMYFMDAFPCYAQPSRARFWLDSNGRTSEHGMLITCIYPPTTITLAYRNSEYNAVQGTTTGMIECPVVGEYDLQVDLQKCTVGKDWKEWK